MSQASIYHQEGFAPFLDRVVDLNRLHNPDDPLHDAILGPRDDPGEGAHHEDAAMARKCLATIHKEFPYGSPLQEQAAFLIRAFTGLAPFSAANFRTGWDHLAGLLQHHGHELTAGDDEAGTLANELWDRMQETYPQGFTRRNVLDRDAVLEYLTAWFRPRISPAP